jgi:hypothetical protein
MWVNDAISCYLGFARFEISLFVNSLIYAEFPFCLSEIFIQLHYLEHFMVKYAILKSSVCSLQIIIIYHVVLKVTSFVLSQK